MTTSDVLVIGGGIAGLAVALLLGRAGLTVTVVEPEPVFSGHIDDPSHWNRLGVPQRGSGHAIHGLVRRILAARAPDILADLVTSGVTERRFDRAIPKDERFPEDADLVALQCRRPVFEMVLRLAVERERTVTLMVGRRVQDLTGDAQYVSGVELDTGERIAARWVVDASGQRGTFRRSFARFGLRPPAIRQQAAATAYYARHFRRANVELAMSEPFHFGVAGDLGFLRFSVLEEDSGWFVVTLNTRSSDHQLRVLSDASAWDSVAASIPGLAPLVARDLAQPMSGVFSFAGRGNVLVEAHPGSIPARLIIVGDALCQTNPTQGWGVSLALREAELAVDAIMGEYSEPMGLLCEYVTPYFETAAAEDRERQRMADGLDVDVENPDSALFIRKCVYPLGAADVALYRAAQRRIHLLEDPRVLPANRELMERARHLAVARGTVSPMTGRMPTRESLISAASGASLV